MWRTDDGEEGGGVRKQGFQLKAGTVILVRGGGGEKWLNSEYNLKGEPTAFADGLEVGCEGEGGVKYDSK